MRLIVLITFYLSATSLVYAQRESKEKSKYNLSVRFGMGLTKFDISGFDTEEYPAMVNRLGLGISRTIIGRFKVESGISIYFRAKSKSPLVDEIYWNGKGALLPRLDATATQPHIAFEVPISVYYLLNGNRSLNTGLLFRHWGPRDPDQRSFMASQSELGYTIGIQQQVIDHLSVGFDLFLGFRDFFKGGVVGSGPIIIKDRSALISLSYTF